MHRPIFFAALASALTFSAAPAVRAQAVVDAPPPARIKIETGINYSRGDYGLPEDTEVMVLPVNLACETRSWTFRATLPWVRIKGPANVLGDGGGGTGGPVRPTNGSESGPGDSSLAATYKLYPGTDRLNVELTGRVKFPTGDDARGIGTGATDYYAQLDLYRTYAALTPFGTVGYRWLGDGRYQLENGFYATGGLLFTLAPGTSLGVSLDWRAKLVTDGQDATEASVFLFKRMNDQWNFSLSVLKGFTDASANYGFGAQFSYAF